MSSEKDEAVKANRIRSGLNFTRAADEEEDLPQDSSPDSKNCGPLPLAGQTATERYQPSGEHDWLKLTETPPDPEKKLSVFESEEADKDQEDRKSDLDLLMKKSQLWRGCQVDESYLFSMKSRRFGHAVHDG